jgi:hypothetical protein
VRLKTGKGNLALLWRKRTNDELVQQSDLVQDEGYEIHFASERNWISYGPDGWVHLSISLDDAKQMCDSHEKVRTDELGQC